MLDKFFKRLGLTPDDSKDVVGGVWLGQLLHQDKLYPLTDYSVRIELIDDAHKDQVASTKESPPARVLGASSWLSTGNVAQWNAFLPLLCDSGQQQISVSKASLRISIYEDGVFTPETLLAVASLSCKDRQDAIDTNGLIELPLGMGPTMPRKKKGIKHLFEQGTTISLKLFTPAMFATVTSLAGHKRGCFGFAGDLDSCTRLHSVWEMFVAHIIPFEGDRPIVAFAAMPSSKKMLCGAGKDSELLVGLPEGVRGEADGNVDEMMGLMEQWCTLHKEKEATALMVRRDVRWSVAELLTEVQHLKSLLVASPESIENEWEEAGRSGVRTIGVVGGMGPVAGGEFGRKLSRELGEGGDFADVKVLMLSDPTPEQWKESTSDLPSSIESTVEILSFLDKKYLRHSCVASNTFHLLTSASGRPKPLLSIFDACAHRILDNHKGCKVGLLCTSPSMQWADSYGYGATFASHKGEVIEWVRPTEEIQEKTMRAITLVKNPAGAVGGSYGQAGELLLDVVRWYAEQGATVCAMCCTEIPLVLSQGEVDNDPALKAKGVALLDSSSVLAGYVKAALLNRVSVYPLVAE
mmetsp:Transcript_28199/g.65850  ORF Transcript_28199/g.65850 Transcript_28199/m.65850 type:complete len:580 (+) Transcript_28199:123-1862(+)|eukprot:CAMPEP_0172001022 /NCGR_PEP_ID=MMETSP1041-20130122/2643_1 /TAXON_ID=464988 /ORGANISM="Hemiselmis andersenii, Strain CCMP439" /LENGTH=579 /DNA_ID=CAMNT_0012654625 /DNA_START=106 /DNA_END=1845 /DNA_ORIENTATION=+